jgi:hypothetical protein
MKHYYENVPRLGNVVLSRHAQANAESLGISEKMVEEVLLKGRDIPDGMDTVWRERSNIRLVIVYPEPYTGARLVATIYKIRRRESAKG